jgi:hypothetical protein
MGCKNNTQYVFCLAIHKQLSSKNKFNELNYFFGIQQNPNNQAAFFASFLWSLMWKEKKSLHTQSLGHINCDHNPTSFYFLTGST